MGSMKPALPGGSVGPIIAGVFAVLAALIGILPDLLNRPNTSVPPVTVTLTSPVLATAIPSMLASETPAVLKTPAPTVLSTNTVPAASPTSSIQFSDSFSGAQIDPAKWEMSGNNPKSPYAQISNGRLMFDASIKAGKGENFLLRAKYPWNSISQIQFTLQLETPLGQNPGFFMVSTNCAGGGRIDFSVVGSTGQIVANYYAGRNEKSPAPIYQLGTLADNNAHTLLMKQVDSSIEIYLDNVRIVDPGRPLLLCKWEVGKDASVSFGVGLNAGSQIKGSFDNISITP